MKKSLLTLYLFSLIFSSFAQTIPVTFLLNANNTQYKTVQMWHQPNYYDFTDDDGDRIFELTLDLAPGDFNYHILRDNAWGKGKNISILDPMISELLPKDGDMLRENRIQANFAYTEDNPPLDNSISVNINGSLVTNPTQYFDAIKRQLLIPNPPFIINGSNTVMVSYSTNKGFVSNSSTFTYQPIKLMIDPMVYRMDHILAWGRVFTKPYPTSVFMKCKDIIYPTTVNNEGYFGADIDIIDGANLIQVATSETGFANPVDQMVVNAELRHKWWVELKGSINGTTANIITTPHDIDQSELTYKWGQSKENPAGLSVSGSSSNLSFEIPEEEGDYIVEMKVTSNLGEVYTARKMLTTKGTPHFIGVNERSPWMNTMVLYEVEGDFFDWGQFSFQNMKQTFQHMKSLGVNTFRITPFNMGGFISWDHFEIDPYNGSMTDLQDMIQTAHRYGLKVFFDVPLSHITSFHSFIVPNFLLKEKAEPYYNFNLWEGNPGESDIIHSRDNGRQCVYTNLDNPYTQEYFTKLMEYWVEVAGCDGFRIDCGQESFLRSPDYIKILHKRLRNINPNLFILEEGDNRADPDVNYYDFGDSSYDWYLNGWNNNEGFPGIFNGTYSVDQLHELLTTGTPDSGLVMRYINTGYFDYFSKRFGVEQERSGVAIITTTYGLPGIRAGEEVGLARANGLIDFTDPLGVMPLYTRLIKARQGLLGNYPEIERITEDISSDVYAYTSKSNGKIVLTVVNFSETQTNVPVNLENSIFENIGKSNWYSIVDDVNLDNTNKTNLTVSLVPWQAKVFAINYVKEEVYPLSSSIKLTTTTGDDSIDIDRGNLNFIASISPENSLDNVVWSLEGDSHLATLINGNLTTCGCGEGKVTVVASSSNNPSVKAEMDISISNQISGQVTNATFDNNIYGWSLWTPECNNTASWDNGEARVSYANGGFECWSQFMGNNDINIESGKSYSVSFDARSTSTKNILCVVREGGNNYDWLCSESSFELGYKMQRFSFDFTANQTSSIGQVQFSMGGGDIEFWFDNVSFCEKIGVDNKVNVTFQVDLQNETTPSQGVYLNGSFCNWNIDNAIKLDAVGSVYSTVMYLEKGETIEYKFVNRSADNSNRYEIITGSCGYGSYMNRIFVVPETDITLDLVCFESCSSCTPLSVENECLESIEVYPNPIKDKITISGLYEYECMIKLFRIDGTLMMEFFNNSNISVELNLHNYDSGIYIICVENEFDKKYFKVIKE